MFNDDDPGLAQLREMALGFPDAFEKISHGRPTFCAPKMFAMFGGSVKVRPGEHIRHPYALLFKADDSERTALEADSRFFHPAYLGPSGWLGIDLDGPNTDWAEIEELIDASFRLIAPAKLIRRLDETET